MGCYICRHTSCVCRCIKRRETSVCHSFLRLYGKSCEPSFRSISRLYQNTFLVVQRNLEWIKDDVNLVNSYIYPSHICNDMHIVTTLYPNVDTHTNKENYILFDGQWVLTKWVIEKPRKMMSCHTQVVIDTRPSESPPLHVYVHIILSFPL